MSNSPPQTPPPVPLGRKGLVIQVDNDQAMNTRMQLNRTLIGIIRDAGFFSAKRVQIYVDRCWLVRGVVNVERRGFLYFFHFTIEEDLDDVVLRSPLNINGALLVLQYWTPNLFFKT
ncbi:hypothetical protein LIER_26173 [Lithospermum erythrorhizon]|uniref:DUF4283 domain-containing protein n=1 Tax=Lithospermum erythrorhizon TaxID=34254 RepID=A0AAV3RB41_LITER